MISEEKLTNEEKKYLTTFVMTRPLDGLNLFDAQHILSILSKINQPEKEVVNNG